MCNQLVANFVPCSSFHCTGRYELDKLTSLQMCGFTDEMVEHCTGITVVMGLNPVEALIFFRLLPSNCLNWKIDCDDHSSPSSTIAVQYIFHTISLHRKIWTQQIDLAPKHVWLHSSVGRASHQYHGCHGFESRWSPDILQACSFQLLKLENLLRWSFFTSFLPLI